jgi:N-acyl-D-amino-acid deacylase
VAESDRPALVGRDLATLATEGGVHPFDLLCDLSLAEGLQTRFNMILANDDEKELGGLLADPRVLLGLSDAGAHASQLCDACFSTHLLQHWVRETGVLSLEMAIWRLTGHPAEVFRMPRRGRIEAGCAADLVAFDPDRVGVAGVERVWDLPAGGDRLLARSQGIDRVWIGGELTWDDGRLTERRPGRLLRDVG